MYKFKLYCYPLLDNNTYQEIAASVYECDDDYNTFTEQLLEHFLWFLLIDQERNHLHKVHIDVFDENNVYYTDFNYIVYLKDAKCFIVEDITKFRDIKIGDIVRHFKYEYLKLEDRNKNMFTYKVLGFGTHTETEEKMVIYQALYAPFEIYIRPYEMFMAEIDHEKYPNSKQVFRFYKVNPNNQ